MNKNGTLSAAFVSGRCGHRPLRGVERVCRAGVYSRRGGARINDGGTKAPPYGTVRWCIQGDCHGPAVLAMTEKCGGFGGASLWPTIVIKIISGRGALVRLVRYLRGSMNSVWAGPSTKGL